MTTDADDAVARRYARFAADEAPGRSAVYARWAAEVAQDPAAAAVIARLPPGRQAPPLVFAVARSVGADEHAALAPWLVRHEERFAAASARRTLQTNEPLRCAALLPALALIPGPIALLELGASAGLCLFPDRYRYRYVRADAVVAVDPPDAPDDAPVLECAVRAPRMPPVAVPEIVWRAGVDRHPLDPRDDGDRAWLETLVWPGEEGRRERVRRALDVAAADPPLLVAGDAAESLAALAALAPADATLVVTTPGLLAHVPAGGRAVVVAAARAAGRWITIDRRTTHLEWAPGDGFALGLDGRVLADVDPLGGWLEWLPDGSPAGG